MQISNKWLLQANYIFAETKQLTLSIRGQNGVGPLIAKTKSNQFYNIFKQYSVDVYTFKPNNYVDFSEP